jgi:hypothetical protein
MKEGNGGNKKRKADGAECLVLTRRKMTKRGGLTLSTQTRVWATITIEHQDKIQRTGQGNAVGAVELAADGLDLGRDGLLHIVEQLEVTRQLRGPDDRIGKRRRARACEQGEEGSHGETRRDEKDKDLLETDVIAQTSK